MSGEDLDLLAPYHEPDLLGAVRVCRVEPPLPWVAGITYADTILIAPGIAADGAEWRRLLFHELVHVVQYRILGLEEFVARYLRGWAAAGYRYREIPLERHAYAMEARFLADPARPFSVRAEVVRQLAAG